jgi:hypothetical protein
MAGKHTELCSLILRRLGSSFGAIYEPNPSCRYMRSYTTHGQTIDVEFRPFGVFLWLLAGFVMRVGGRTFYPKLTSIRFTTATEFDFDLDGRRISGVIRSLGPMWLTPRMRYAIIVGDSEVTRDIQTLRHWYVSYFAWGVACIVLLLALYGAVAYISACLR